MPNSNKLKAFIKRQPRWRIAGVVLILALAGVWFRSGGKSTAGGATFAARRGPLAISVLEGGSIQALESQEIKCEVRVGYQGTKILKIVEEGYLVTEDDVKTNKVLVELDSSELQKQIIQQEIQYQSAGASLTALARLFVLSAASSFSRPSWSMISSVTVSPRNLSKSIRAKRAFCSAALISLMFWFNWMS